ncbi:class I SAM-dependent methyltransferase [Actinophytocola sp. NPDC049390]|uniref:class I SAM-dependent methyltransferase n=1 Tax=Actinophytocola sp. NPDC049390 TaxID=3363894 RepID=UPI0037B45CAF
MHPLRQRTEPPTIAEIEEEWRRRARRTGLGPVMRASQPAELAPAVTAATRGQVAGHLDRLSVLLGRPLRSALEIGCGIGRLTPTIAATAERVLAVDMTEEMLARARVACAGLGNVEFQRRTAQRLAIPESRVDVAVCVWVLMHVLDDAEFAAACRGIARSAAHLVLVEYTDAAVPVGRYSRLRSLADYLDALPGARLVERGELCYGGDVSFSALIALDQP